MKKIMLRFVAFLLLLTTVCGALSLPSLIDAAKVLPAVGSDAKKTSYTVVIDPGHGGEDAGASGKNGVREKDINLAIAFDLRDLLVANGVSVVLTRETDILLYDRNVDYHGRKKALDLAARRRIAEDTENCIFVSIHMNSFPQEKYSGLQVWYSKHHIGSKILAETLQNTAKVQLQPQNNRLPKPATSAIYLLHHLQMPAVLVECGFLSNPGEAERLSTREYQRQLAFLIFLSLTEGFEKIADNA